MGNSNKSKVKTVTYKDCLYKGNLYPEWNWKRGIPNGTGMIIYPNGDRYIGNFVLGMRHGEGIFNDAYGKIIVKGNWENGEVHGKAYFRYANGEYYNGEFYKGVRSGRGHFIWPDGEEYEGLYEDDWKNDKNGIMRFRNGHRYEGGWKLNRICGCGRIIFRNGDVLEAHWWKDAMVGNIKIYCNYSGDSFEGKYLFDDEIEHPSQGCSTEDSISRIGMESKSVTDIHDVAQKCTVWDGTLLGTRTYTVIGLQYQGRLVGGKRDGPGVLRTVFGGGVIFDGIWKENLFVESKSESKEDCEYFIGPCSKSSAIPSEKNQLSIKGFFVENTANKDDDEGCEESITESITDVSYDRESKNKNDFNYLNSVASSCSNCVKVVDTKDFLVLSTTHSTSQSQCHGSHSSRHGTHVQHTSAGKTPPRSFLSALQSWTQTIKEENSPASLTSGAFCNIAHRVYFQ